MLNHFQVGHELFPSRHSSQAGPFFKTKTMGNWGSQNCYRVALCQFTNALKLWAGLEKSCVDVLTWKPVQVDRSGASGVFFIATSAILIAWSGLFLNITIPLFYSYCKWICQTWAGSFGRTASFSILTPNMDDSFQSLTPKDQTENILTWKQCFKLFFSFAWFGYVRSHDKQMLFFWILSKLPPPLPKIGTTCTTFFDVKIQHLNVSLELKIVYLLQIYTYIIYIQTKKSLEFKFLAFWRKQFPFIVQKCT